MWYRMDMLTEQLLHGCAMKPDTCASANKPNENTDYIGGSVASSVYGIARATMDIDVIVHIAPDQVSSLVSLLEEDYYIDEQMIIDAISSASSFNLKHNVLGTGKK